MENAEALRLALQKLAQKRATLGADLQRERDDLQRLQEQIGGLEKNRADLEKRISADETAFEHMDTMISQTEEGYRQMLETAQTLMDVVAMQMPGIVDERGPSG